MNAEQLIADIADYVLGPDDIVGFLNFARKTTLLALAVFPSKKESGL